jgi:hypothetical protein
VDRMQALQSYIVKAVQGEFGESPNGSEQLKNVDVTSYFRFCDTEDVDKEVVADLKALLRKRSAHVTLSTCCHLQFPRNRSYFEMTLTATSVITDPIASTLHSHLNEAVAAVHTPDSSGNQRYLQYAVPQIPDDETREGKSFHKLSDRGKRLALNEAGPDVIRYIAATFPWMKTNLGLAEFLIALGGRVAKTVSKSDTIPIAGRVDTSPGLVALAQSYQSAQTTTEKNSMLSIFNASKLSRNQINDLYFSDSPISKDAWTKASLHQKTFGVGRHPDKVKKKFRTVFNKRLMEQAITFAANDDNLHHLAYGVRYLSFSKQDGRFVIKVAREEQEAKDVQAARDFLANLA